MRAGILFLIGWAISLAGAECRVNDLAVDWEAMFERRPNALGIRQQTDSGRGDVYSEEVLASRSWGGRLSHSACLPFGRRGLRSAGFEEGARFGNRAEAFVRARTEARYGPLQLGANLGPARRTGPGNPLDVEANVWAGSLVVANVRFPSLIGEPGAEPVYGLSMTLSMLFPARGF